MKQAFMACAFVLVSLFMAAPAFGQGKDPCVGKGTDCFEREVKVNGYAPGPWVYDEKEATVYSGAGVTVDEDWEGGFPVATVAAEIWPPDIVKNNGLLVAATPELYKFVLLKAEDGDKDAQSLLISLNLSSVVFGTVNVKNHTSEAITVYVDGKYGCFASSKGSCSLQATAGGHHFEGRTGTIETVPVTWSTHVVRSGEEADWNIWPETSGETVNL